MRARNRDRAGADADRDADADRKPAGHGAADRDAGARAALVLVPLPMTGGELGRITDREAARLRAVAVASLHLRGRTFEEGDRWFEVTDGPRLIGNGTTVELRVFARRGGAPVVIGGDGIIRITNPPLRHGRREDPVGAIVATVFGLDW